MKQSQCDACQFYASSPYLVCAVHPHGPASDGCPDFHLQPNMRSEELWAPPGYSFYGGELIKQPAQTRTRAELLQLLDTHPFFTGRCPRCDYRFDARPAVHWDCPRCGWIDDSV